MVVIFKVIVIFFIGKFNMYIIFGLLFVLVVYLLILIIKELINYILIVVRKYKIYNIMKVMYFK